MVKKAVQRAAKKAVMRAAKRVENKSSEQEQGIRAVNRSSEWEQ